jgi:CheY-like chemotaxis protein
METKKILVVDDDVDIQTMLTAILKKENYTVINAADKKEALEILKTETPDLAILDVMMTTRHEGFELAEAIKSNSELNFPILMHTSIDVLTTTKPSVQAMAREFRTDPNNKDLQVILIKDITTGNAGIDYLAANGETIWLPVDGFVKKPVNAKNVLPEVARLLTKEEA